MYVKKLISFAKTNLDFMYIFKKRFENFENLKQTKHFFSKIITKKYSYITIETVNKRKGIPN
jgi:hypothetical protein